MSTELFDLTGRVAIVTGSTRGIGLGIAKALCGAGAKCVVSSESEIDVKTATQALYDLGYEAVGKSCDVTKAEEQANLIAATIEHYGRIDILVCNAGITGKAGPITETEPVDYSHVFDVNLHSMVGLTNAVYHIMKAQKSGSIILMSSIAGLRGNASINAYALTKAGVAQLARNLAVQWGPDGIRANSISPGFIRTAISEPLLADEDFVKRRTQMTPLRRFGDVEDVAGCALFLASSAAQFVTGHNLVVDGGTTITDGS